MTAPQNLIELNRSLHHDSVLLTQKLQWMLWIRQVGFEWGDINNDNISRRLQMIKWRIVAKITLVSGSAILPLCLLASVFFFDELLLPYSRVER
jgi:hypothetical protein